MFNINTDCVNDPFCNGLRRLLWSWPVFVITLTFGAIVPPPAAAQTGCSGLWSTDVALNSPPVNYTVPAQLGSQTAVSMSEWVNLFADQPWASVVSFNGTGFGATVRLDVTGLAPGPHCFNLNGGDIQVIAKIINCPQDPRCGPRGVNAGDPCGSNFDSTKGWFNLGTTVPWDGPCELKAGVPGGLSNLPFVTLGAVAVNVVTTKVSLVDPVPDLVSAGATVAGSQLQALLKKGTIVSGAAADGVTQLVIRIQGTVANHQFAVTLFNDQGSVSGLPNEDGALGNPGDTNPSVSTITVSSGSVGGDGEAYAFAVYRAPLDFARPTGPSAFKSGSCNGATNTDDQLGCRSVSLKVQDVTLSGSTPVTTAITIVRPPVFLIHGLWGNYGESWKNFSPLVKGKNSVDKRFYVGRPNFDNAINPPLTASAPAYMISLGGATGSSLGILYNTPRVLKQITDSIDEFKNGKNPVGLAVAAVQGDVVAHSMGGLITRTMPLLTGFLSDPTFNQGPIHKVITIDTPHLGTPLPALLLDPSADCSRGMLAGPGYFSFSSATQQGSSTSIPGAVADLQTNSGPLQAIAKAGPHLLPTAIIVGIYTNFASLDCKLCAANYIRSKCGSGDAVAAKLTGTAWPLIFGPTGSNDNDALVGKASQLNGPGSGSVFTGYLHSPGLTNLSFTGPSVLDPDVIGTISVPNQVIQLLNTPYTQSAFQSLNP